MGDYTPKTENVRLGYAYRHNLPAGERHPPGVLAEFDRWLAAHDAEVRASLVTEEPDWEYGVVRHDGVMVNNGDYMIQQTHRRRKAGPWVPVPTPVQQEGTEE